MNSHEEVIVAVLENKAVAMWCTSCSLAHPANFKAVAMWCTSCSLAHPANFILVTSMNPCP
jgi:hypothetical protein